MTKQDIATIPVASAAVAWPALQDWLHWIAGEAQVILPLLGATWLVVQILAKIYSTWFKRG